MPIVKTPMDILTLGEVIVQTRPELIVESGAFAGGSALYYATLLELLGGEGRVIAIDLDFIAVPEIVRAHPRVELVQGSSVDPAVLSRVRAAARGRRVMVDLDSDHASHHVLAELRALASLVTPGCYLIVEDTWLGGRPVNPDAAPGPSDALDAWLAEGQPFEVDCWRERMLLTGFPRGYLLRLGEDGAAPPGEREPHFLVAGLDAGGDATTATAGRDADASPAAGRPEAARDRELESLRRTVRNLAEGERRLRAQLDDERADRVGQVGELRDEAQRQRRLLGEKDRQLAAAHVRIEQLGRFPALRAYNRLISLPGLRRIAARRSRRDAEELRALRRSAPR